MGNLFKEFLVFSIKSLGHPVIIDIVVRNGSLSGEQMVFVLTLVSVIG